MWFAFICCCLRALAVYHLWLSTTCYCLLAVGVLKGECTQANICLSKADCISMTVAVDVVCGMSGDGYVQGSHELPTDTHWYLQVNAKRTPDSRWNTGKGRTHFKSGCSMKPSCGSGSSYSSLSASACTRAVLVRRLSHQVYIIYSLSMLIDRYVHYSGCLSACREDILRRLCSL